MIRVAFAPLFLVVILGAIVGLVLRKRRGALAIIGGLLAAVLVAAFFIRANSAPTFYREAPARQWVPSDAQLANASVYPSAEAAARFVGTTLAPKVAMRTGNERISEIDLDGNAPKPIQAIIATKIIDACPHLRLTNPRMPAESTQTTRPADHLILTVNDTEDFSGRGERMLQATAEIPRISGSSVGANAYYENKPWAEKPPGFHHVSPGRQYLVAWAENAAASSEDALAQARRSAARQYLPRVWQVLKQQRPNQEFDGARILNDLEVMIATGRISHEQFVQRMGRSYGNIWRAAIRVDASDSTAQFVAANLASEMNASRRDFGTRMLSVSALLALIVIVYFLLNAITKGYFSKTLQTGAIVALLIGLLALMLMA